MATELVIEKENVAHLTTKNAKLAEQLEHAKLEAERSSVTVRLASQLEESDDEPTFESGDPVEEINDTDTAQPVISYIEPRMKYVFVACSDKENDAAKFYVENDGRTGLDFGNNDNVVALAKEFGLKSGSFRTFLTRCGFKKEKGFCSNRNPERGRDIYFHELFVEGDPEKAARIKKRPKKR